jgi:hypothetical protein
MELSPRQIKFHIVAELLIIKFSKQRGLPVPDASTTFWIYYWQDLKAMNYAIEPLINEDQEMAQFYEEWEEYDTYLSAGEIRLPVITLAMKLVMAKALKYADDATLASMLDAINEKLKMSRDW